MPALVAQPAAVRALHLVSEEQSRHWKSIQPTFAKQNGMYNSPCVRMSCLIAFLSISELANAGKITPITGKPRMSLHRPVASSLILPILSSEILKAHRTSYLYDNFGMYNVPISDPNLEAIFKDQLLVRYAVHLKFDTCVIG